MGVDWPNIREWYRDQAFQRAKELSRPKWQYTGRLWDATDISLTPSVYLSISATGGFRLLFQFLGAWFAIYRFSRDEVATEILKGRGRSAMKMQGGCHIIEAHDIMERNDGPLNGNYED